MTRSAIFLLAALAAGSGLLAAPRHASAPAVPAAPRVPGPGAVEPPAGATVATAAGDLQRLLDDPQGPREVWIKGRVVGDVVVRRPVALRGAPGAVLQGSGHGTVLGIEADDVLVEDLVVRGSGRRHTAEDAGVKAKGARVVVRRLRVEDSLFGVALGPCPACRLEDTTVVGPGGEGELRGDGIKLWEAHDAVVRGCRMERSRDLVVWYSRRVRLEDNEVVGSRYGSHFMYAHDAHVVRGRLVDNVVGVFVMYSNRVTIEDSLLAGARGPAGVGVGFKESDRVELRRNRIVANTTGAYFDRTPRSPSEPVVLEQNLLAINDVGFRFHGADEGITLRDNDFHRNAVVAEVEGGGNALGARFEGNHWSDYAGYDLDGDGQGDVPFEVRRLSGELTDARPTLRLFQGTAALLTIDAVAQAVPVLSRQLLLVDRSPRMQRRLP